MNSFLLPSPQMVWKSFWSLIASGKLADHAGISITRVLTGYAIAALLALALSLAMAASRILAAVIDPPLDFLRQVPPLALMPLAMLWLGIGETQKVGIIVLACFFPIFLGFRGGFSQVDPKLIEVGRVAGFSRTELLRRIALPAALPAIIVGLRLGLGYGWRALVGAELIASSAGLGYMILDAQDLARTDIVMVGILVIGSIGLLADWGLKALVRRTLPWIRQDLELGNG
ncbi:ABC transporter permease [Paracoccus sp. (in: a-proteobacteria)]|uniref:ABC transporter permease n=1 Tax=Paracoccus sp. TaxID=267 RepID=UPI00289B2CEB|nr:ABC transporter permease [Paracoccus sp. (in: a-proteobacteria)]